MPIPDLAQAVEFYQPDLLALSVSLHTQLVTLAETIQAVRCGQRGAVVKILVGGRALADATDLAQQFGADGYAADPNAAVAWGRAMVGQLDPHACGRFVHEKRTHDQRVQIGLEKGADRICAVSGRRGSSQPLNDVLSRMGTLVQRPKACNNS